MKQYILGLSGQSHPACGHQGDQWIHLDCRTQDDPAQQRSSPQDVLLDEISESVQKESGILAQTPSTDSSFMQIAKISFKISG